jgi:hypothetical protein
MKIIFISVMLAAASASAANTINIECPPEFPETAISFNDAVPGWTPYMPTSLHVSSADLMYGPPQSHLLAKPATYRRLKGRETATWHLKDQATTPKWLSCSYGATGEVTLSTRLPANVAECTVTVHKESDGNVTTVVASCI